MEIRDLRLLTSELRAQREFYEHLLQLPIVVSRDDSVTVSAGATRLTFAAAPAGLDPIYHFAFNIPENQFVAAKTWLADRVQLLPGEHGRDDFAFPNWNAHACYFFDAAGNVVEFIARHDLSNAASQFTSREILCVSEIGLVVEDVPAAVASLDRELRLTPYRSGSPTFTAVGDANALLIVVPPARAWFPTHDHRAAQFPVAAELVGDTSGVWRSGGELYRIALTQPARS